MQIDGLILAGGKSSRMGGRNKGSLVYGKQTFLDRIIGEFAKETEHIWVSCGDRILQEYEGCQSIQDEFPGCGPIGGLYTGLGKCRGDFMMTAACDMPFLEIALYRYLMEQLRLAEKKSAADTRHIYMGAVPMAEGRLHPLAAIYRKELEKTLEGQIKAGNYRMRDALVKERILYVDIAKEPQFQKMLFNVNTISDYEGLQNFGLDRKRESR